MRYIISLAREKDEGKIVDDDNGRKPAKDLAIFCSQMTRLDTVSLCLINS